MFKPSSCKGKCLFHTVTQVALSTSTLAYFYLLIYFCWLSLFGVGRGLLAVSADHVWALISLLRKGSVLWEKGELECPCKTTHQKEGFVLSSRGCQPSQTLYGQ